MRTSVSMHPGRDAAPTSTPASTSRRRRSETTHLDKDAFRRKPDVLVRNLAGCPRQMIVPSTSTGSRQAFIIARSASCVVRNDRSNDLPSKRQIGRSDIGSQGARAAFVFNRGARDMPSTPCAITGPEALRQGRSRGVESRAYARDSSIPERPCPAPAGTFWGPQPEGTRRIPSATLVHGRERVSRKA